MLQENKKNYEFLIKLRFILMHIYNNKMYLYTIIFNYYTVRAIVARQLTITNGTCTFYNFNKNINFLKFIH